MADRWLYRGKIDHTKKTIELMFTAQRNTYDKLRVLLRLIIGAGLAVAALTVALPMWARTLLLLFGGWLLASKDFPSQTRADRTMDARGGSLPCMSYTFFENRMDLSGEGSMSVGYKKIDRLVEDDGYLYVFMSRDSVCMIDRSTVEPGGADELKKFLEGKTGLKWRREKSLLSMNLYDIRQLIKDIRHK